MARCIPVLCLLLAASARAYDDPDTEAARRHFTAGAALYEDGKYGQAIVEFSAARVLRPSPALDYNIGRCHDRLEHTADAIDGYQRFLDQAQPGAQTDEVRTRLEVLRARLATPPIVPVAAPVPTIDTHGPRHRYSVAVPAAVTSVAGLRWRALRRQRIEVRRPRQSGMRDERVLLRLEVGRHTQSGARWRRPAHHGRRAERPSIALWAGCKAR